MTSQRGESGSVSLAIGNIIDCLVFLPGAGVLGFRDAEGTVGGGAESDSVVELASSPLALAFDKDV